LSMNKLTLSEVQARLPQIVGNEQFDWERVIIADQNGTLAGLVPPTEVAILREIETVPLDLIADALEYARQENVSFREALLEEIECRFDLKAIEEAEKEEGFISWEAIKVKHGYLEES